MPTTRDLHVDTLLTNISIAYKNVGYIHDLIAPIVPVNAPSGIIPVYNQSDWFRDDAKIRAPRSRSEGGDYTVTSDTFSVARYSYRSEIGDEERDIADSVWDLEVSATEFATDKILMRQERSLAAEIMTTGIWGNDDAGGTDFTQWSDYAASTPLENATSYMDEIEGRIGVEPNTLVIGKQVWNQLRWHPELIDTVKFTQRGVLDEALVASLLGVDRLLIGRALVTTTPEGTAESSVTYSRVWGKAALFLYVPQRANLRTPASMYTFTWNRVPNSLRYVVRYRDDERETDIVEANGYWQHKVTSGRAGTYLATVVA
jgi:hypothetical protein